MAHPLTQHPHNVLPFGAPASMSPLGFGFGQPHGAGSAPCSPRPAGFGFGSPLGAAGPSTTPLKRMPPPRTSPSASPAPTTVKRSRRRSSSSSLSPSPHGSPSLSRRRPDDDEPRERKIAARKRFRKEQTEHDSAQPASAGPDVGLLLASFPPTSHLPILLELLNENPHLVSRVLKNMPQPPLANCLETLERTVAKIGKAAGSWEPQSGYVAQRRWNRVEPLISEFEKTATTYLKFFTQPTSTTISEPNSIYHLLEALTAQILQLLGLVPQTNGQPPPSARPLLDLANLVLTSWNQWISGLSDEVNNRGGMYPHPTVTSWADGLAGLSRASPVVQPPIPQSSWITPITMPAQQVDNHLADGFRQALQPIQDKFANELGWLVRP